MTLGPKTLKDWYEIFKKGAQTLLEELKSDQKDLEWLCDAIGIALISQGSHTPMKGTEAYEWLKSEMKDRSRFNSKADLIPILEDFVRKIESI